MPTIPSQIQTALDSGSTTLATCWYVLMTDGTELGFTDHDQDIIYYNSEISGNEITYQANSGLLSTARSQSSNLSVDNSDFSGPIQQGGITIQDAENGKYDSMEVKIFRIDWRNPSNGIIKLQSGIMGEFKREDGMFTAELRTLAQKMRRRTGKRVMPICDAVFGDSNCTKDLSGLTETATVVAVTSANQLTLSISGVNYENKYTLGYVTFTSGDASGQSSDIRSYDVDTSVIQTQESIPILPSPGDTCTIVAGCDKSWQYCRDVHQNHKNFQGYPYVPVGDIIFQIATEDTQPSQIASSVDENQSGGAVPSGSSFAYQRTFNASDIEVAGDSGLIVTVPDANDSNVGTGLLVKLSTSFDAGDLQSRVSYNLDSFNNVGVTFTNYKDSGKYVIGVVDFSLAANVPKSSVFTILSDNKYDFFRNSDPSAPTTPVYADEVWNNIAYTNSSRFNLTNPGKGFYSNYTLVIDLDNNKFWIKGPRGWIGGNPFPSDSGYLSTGIATNMSNRTYPVTVGFLPALPAGSGSAMYVYPTRTFNLDVTELKYLIADGYQGWDAS